MEMQLKASYNLLWLKSLEDNLLKCEKWQIEDWRLVPLEDLFSSLSKLGINWNKELFVQTAEKYDSPEELSQSLFAKNLEFEHIFLIVFELWRRLLPEKKSISIFCDEFDKRIYLYDNGELENDELIQDSLTELKSILDESAGRSAKAKKSVFELLSSYCANDIQSFIYDYIAEQMDAGNRVYATELLENFYDYLTNVKWLDFLKVRLLTFIDIGESNAILHRLIKELEKVPELDLQFEILHFMVESATPDLFAPFAKVTLSLIKAEGEFVEILEMSVDYFRYFDQKELEHAFKKILSKRKVPLDKILSQSDPDLLAVMELLTLRA